MPAEIPNPRIVVLRAGQTVAEHELPPDGELVVGRTPQCPGDDQNGDGAGEQGCAAYHHEQE